MSVLRTLLFVLIAGFVALFLLMRHNSTAYNKPFGSLQVTSPNAFAVVELFTSQNCTACNDANRMISDILSETDTVGLPVYVLSFHSDHMDNHHWQDSYGKSLFSDRFRAYIMAQKKQYDALPQIFFNGHNVLTSPNRMKTYHLLADFLATHTPRRLDLWGEMTGKRFLTLHFKGIHFPRTGPLVLHAALVEKGLQKNVASGPNEGMTLLHDNVVREFLTVDFPQSGEGSVDLFIKDHYLRPNTKVIAYIQDSGSMRILAASQLGLSDVSEEIVYDSGHSFTQDDNESHDLRSVAQDPAIPAALR